MTSSRYVVDSDILILIQRARLEARFEQLGRLPIIVTAIAWDEVVGPNASQPLVAGLRSMLIATAGTPTDFEADSHEAWLFSKLQEPPPTEDAGEHSVIAHVLTHDDTIAVLNDKKAIQRATEEMSRTGAGAPRIPRPHGGTSACASRPRPGPQRRVLPSVHARTRTAVVAPARGVALAALRQQEMKRAQVVD